MSRSHFTPDGDPSGPRFYRKADGGYVRPVLSRDLLEKMADSLPMLGDGSPRWYGLALVILAYVFGEKWIVRHVLDERRDGFFARGLGSEYGSARVMHRIRDLAEFVINLITVRGVEAPLDQIYGGQIESGFAELEAGKLLTIHDLRFRFIWPSGVKRESFDLEVMFPNGRPVCADTKCKIETEQLSKNGMINTLDTARKRNLPKGYPGLIIVKIPQPWFEAEDVMMNVMEQCDDFLRGTKRIVSVIIFSSLFHLIDGVMASRLIVAELINKQHDQDVTLNWQALPAGIVDMPLAWLSLSELTKEQPFK